MALLNESDLQSPTWGKLRKYFEMRLDELRVKNDCRMGEEDTAYLRGRIAEARYFLGLAERNDPKPPS